MVGIQVDTRKDVVVLGLFVRTVHADGNRDVRHEAGVEPKPPPQRPILSFERARNHERGSEFIIDKQELADWVAENLATRILQSRGNFGQEFWIRLAKGSVYLNVSVVSIRQIPDQRIGPQQTAKSRPIQT